MRTLKPVLASVALVGGLAATTIANAWTTWTFMGTNNCISAYCGGWDYSRTYTPSAGYGPNAKVTAYSGYVDGGVYSNLDTAKVTGFSGGLGVSRSYAGGATESNPQHSIDNVTNTMDPSWADYDQDFVLFDFGASHLVALDYIDAGWYQNDADVDLYAWEGAGNPSSLTSLGADDLVGDGWTLVTGSALYNIQNGRSFNTDHSVRSRYWLAGASLAGSYKADYFKLKVLKGKKYTPPPPPSGNGVPVPAPLAMIVGMLGVMSLQRRFGK